MNRIACLTIAAALVAPAFASAPDAWADYEPKVIAACTAATGLSTAEVISELITYDDTVGFDALMLTGQDAQGGAAGMLLCVYDRAQEKAAVSPITPK